MDELLVWNHVNGYLTGALPAQKVRVTANDYAYEGWMTGVVRKHSGAILAVVEDDNGRLFIHNAKQLELI